MRRRRLLALAVVAIAVAAAAIAAATGETAVNAIDNQWRLSVHDGAARGRLWMVGAARTLTATAQAVVYANDDRARCDAALGQTLADDEEYKAIRIDFGDGRGCVRAADATLAGAIGSVSEELRAQPKIETAPGVALAIENVRASGGGLLAIQVDASPANAPKASVTALVDSRMLAQAIELNPDKGGVVALMSRGEEIVAVGETISFGSNWLPATAAPVGADYQATTTQSRTGATAAYATQPILGTDFYVLSRFGNPVRQSAQIRYLALALAPILLATICLALTRALHAELLRGIGAIKAAMLGRKTGKRAALAPEDDAMPRELRDLAVAYNEMARESAIREQSLQASIAENEFLLRELNHRVKSSLQIIQSYVSLTRRLDQQSGHHTNAAAIEARVQVLSTAYRKAFSEGRMRDVRIRQFAEEIVANLARLFGHPGLTLDVEPNVDAALAIDNAIPVGLAMVECVIAGMDARGARSIVVRIRQLDDLLIELDVLTDGKLRDGEPNAKLMGGLALQLAATVERPEPGSVIRWRFQGRPPPLLSHSEPWQLALA